MSTTPIRADERAAAIVQSWLGQKISRNEFQRAIAAAVVEAEVAAAASEREACAQAAESAGDVYNIGNSIAAAIRARNA